MIAFECATEALKALDRDAPPDGTIVTDITIPLMDGWETLAALRALRTDLPVILASGYDEAQVMLGDRPELPQAFLHKPYRMKHLKEALGRFNGAFVGL